MWKLSPTDLDSLDKWEDYSEAKDIMFAYTDTKQAPWTVVDSTIKRHARLNCIADLLSKIHYEDLTPEKVKIPKYARKNRYYIRTPIDEQTFAA